MSDSETNPAEHAVELRRKLAHDGGLLLDITLRAPPEWRRPGRNFSRRAA
jgi:hypothetical protein